MAAPSATSPAAFLREIEPEYIEETRSPVLEQRSRLGGWGSGYGSDTVPGGASGYSGPSGWGVRLRSRLGLWQPQQLSEQRI